MRPLNKSFFFFVAAATVLEFEFCSKRVVVGFETVSVFSLSSTRPVDLRTEVR